MQNDKSANFAWWFLEQSVEQQINPDITLIYLDDSFHKLTTNRFSVGFFVSHSRGFNKKDFLNFWHGTSVWFGLALIWRRLFTNVRNTPSYWIHHLSTNKKVISIVLWSYIRHNSHVAIANDEKNLHSTIWLVIFCYHQLFMNALIFFPVFQNLY